MTPERKARLPSPTRRERLPSPTKACTDRQPTGTVASGLEGDRLSDLMIDRTDCGMGRTCRPNLFVRMARYSWGMLVRMCRRWYDQDWHDLNPGHVQMRMGWKCDLCAKCGEGDADTFFAHSEIEHLLATGCPGSLRRIVPPVKAAEELSRPVSGSLSLGVDNISLGHDSLLRVVQSRPDGEGRTNTGVEPRVSPRHAFDYISPRWTGLQEIPAGAGRTVILGLGSYWVDAGRTISIDMSSKESFDVRSLFIPHGVAESFLIEGISIGSERLLKGPLPGIMFTDDSFNMLAVRRLPHPGMVVVEITNMGTVGMCFEGCLMGPAAPGSYRASGTTGWEPGPFPGVDHVREKD